MKTIAKIALAGALLLGVSSTGSAQNGVPPRVTVLPCCKCVGEGSKADLSTGTAAWTVVKPSGGPATPVVPASNTAWSTIPGAQWVGPAGGSTTGVYVFETKIDLRRCVIPSASITISGRFLADNTAQLLVDGIPVATSIGTANYGFLPGSLTPFSYSFPAGASGVHTVTVKVSNISGPVGLNVSAAAVRRCVSSPEVNPRGGAAID